MSIFRINEYQAKEGQGDLLLETLSSYDSIFKFMSGYQSLQLLQSVENPDRIVVIEGWDSINSHKTAVKKIPVHAFEIVTKLLASSPKGAYYRQ